MVIGSEVGSVQKPFVRYATEAGWTYLSPDEALNRRRGVVSPVLDAVLSEQLQRLNPGIVDHQRADDTIKRLVRVRPNIEGNLDAWEYLKGLKTVFVPEEKRERNIRLLDTDKPEANRFHVTDEFTFSNGTPPDIRADIVFFVNGVPVIIVETKRAINPEGIAEAFDDIRYYHDQGPEFLALNQVHTLTHLIQFYYGATWNLTRKGLFNWRDEQVTAGDFETLCKTFVAPRRVLRVLTEYILFTRKDEELAKVVLRPHQMRAVERCIARSRDKKKRRGLVWHTQGSGKTYTMITAATRILEDPTFGNPTVIMLVDRNELEAQLFGNLESVGFGHVEVARSKENLRDLLASDRRGLIVSMIHKFDRIPDKVTDRDNVFVLVDEAHRTTGGDLGNYLMGALPNATYIGFTGTPIDKTAYGKGTFKTFGIDDDKGYLDKYSIRESIQDGTTVPLHYALAPNDLQVDRDTLDKEFLSLQEAEGISDIEELNKVLEKAVTLRNMLKNRDRIKKVAKYAAEHFKSVIEPMGYKAFLVAVDREACCLYKEALDKHLPAECSTVVISRGGKKDPPLLRKCHLSDDDEKRVRLLFRKPEEQPKILIVTEKLLTGFDAPILYCIYLDKPMRDHVLLQAIARVNRPYEDDEGRRKPSGFVLDFVGIFDNLEKALAFDSKDVKGVIEGVDVLKDYFKKLIAKGQSEYLVIIKSKKADKQVEALLEHFRDKELRQEYYSFFKEIQDVYEILSPDAFLRPYIPEYNDLTRMYYLLRANYDRGKVVDKAFLRKTAKLVQKHTESGLIEEPDKVYALDAKTLDKISKVKQSDTVKVFNLLRAIHGLVGKKASTDPYLIQIGDRAKEIAEAFERRQMTTKEALIELERLIAEFKEAEKSRDDTGLSPEAFAVYWFLKREEISNPMKVAEQAAEAFENHPYWQTSEHHEQEVRKAVYKSLIDAAVENVVEIATKLMTMLRRASR
jgi:type I restriction enzyme R subunit